MAVCRKDTKSVQLKDNLELTRGVNPHALNYDGLSAPGDLIMLLLLHNLPQVHSQASRDPKARDANADVFLVLCLAMAGGGFADFSAQGAHE